MLPDNELPIAQMRGARFRGAKFLYQRVRSHPTHLRGGVATCTEMTATVVDKMGPLTRG
jgi:hypothetical protein